MFSSAPSPARPPAGAGPALRWARAGLLAACAWGVASAAHVLGGGELPSSWVVLALITLSAWPMSLLLSGPAGVARLTVLLAAGQAFMHASLVVSAWARMTTVPLPGAGTAGGSMHDMHLVPLPDTGQAASTTAVPMGHVMPLLPGPWMLAMHVVAAIVLALVLAHGERTLFSLLALLALAARPLGRADQRVRTALALISATPCEVPVLLEDRQRTGLERPRLHRLLLTTAIPHRGPPGSLIRRGAACHAPQSLV